MNLTLNKALKAVVSLVLCLCICFSLTACTKNTKNIKKVDQICVSGSYIESWMNVFADEEFVSEMVEIYNGIRYEKSEEYVDMMTAGEVLSFSFNNGSDNVAKLIVDKNLNMAFEAGGKPFKITSDFDFDYVKGLVDAQKTAVSDSLKATPDQA